MFCYFVFYNSLQQATTVLRLDLRRSLLRMLHMLRRSLLRMLRRSLLRMLRTSLFKYVMYVDLCYVCYVHSMLRKYLFQLIAFCQHNTDLLNLNQLKQQNVCFE